MLRFSSASAVRWFPTLCLISGVLLLAVGCGQNATSGQAQQTSVDGKSASTQNCDMQASWAEGFNSLKSLKQAKDLDLAVQGKFTKILSTEGSMNPSGDSLFTNLVFTVSKVLLSSHNQLNGSVRDITIHQSGGLQGNTLHQVCGDPLFQVGEEAILFLHQFSPGHYMVIGGPSGRFVVRDGLVQSVGDFGVKLPAGLSVQQYYALWEKA